MCNRQLLRAARCEVSRQYLLCATFGAVAVVARMDAPRESPRADDMSPSEALDRLYAGNKRFAAGRPEAPRRGRDRLRDVAAAQRPFAAVLGCADSRVPVELLFDQGLGDLFVTRVAGNVTTVEGLGTLEYGVHVLGVRVIYVLGHTDCGAVAAAVTGDPLPGCMNTLCEHLRPAVAAAAGDPAEAVRENVRRQVRVLRTASPLIADQIRCGRLCVAGGVYDVATGTVVAVDVEATEFRPRLETHTREERSCGSTCSS